VVGRRGSGESEEAERVKREWGVEVEVDVCVDVDV